MTENKEQTDQQEEDQQSKDIVVERFVCSLFIIKVTKEIIYPITKEESLRKKVYWQLEDGIYHVISTHNTEEEALKAKLKMRPETNKDE
jgi:hypothetical protein